MKFNNWSRKRLQEGKKRLTSRRTQGEFGHDKDISNIIGPLPWWFIKEYLYRDEGAESPEELQRVINQIFRRHVELNEMFFVHVLSDYCIERATLGDWE